MDCRAFRNSFSDYLDGALGAADEVRWRLHRDVCPACRRFEAAYRTGLATLRELDPPSPARDFSVRVLHRVRRERHLPILAGGYGLAAALLTVTLVGVVTVEVREHRAAAVRAAAAEHARAAERAALEARRPAPGAPDLEDLLTVQMRGAHADPFAGDPYAAVPVTIPFPASRYRVEVPAVWSGR